MGARFYKCDDDVRIVHIGKVLVRTSDTSYRPSIEVWCYPPQQKNGFYATAFSNVPALYRGKIINQRELSESYLKRGRHTFKGGEYLRKSTLSEFPDSGSAESLRKKESEQNAFVLDNRGNAPKLIIPQLELARVLFYASSYLSRASLMSSRLLTDFKVDINTKEDYANIEVLQTSNFPPSAFNDSATRAMLSWLLIDRNAKRSFESIFKYFNTENHLDVSSGYQRWLFHFDPPQLEGCSLSYEGSLDASGEYFLVEKITDIEINAQMPSRVYFHNPSFTHQDESAEPTVGGQGPKPYERPEDHTVDDEREASDSNQAFLLGENTCSIRFKNCFLTSKSTTPKRGHRSDSTQEPPKKAGETVSTNEPGSNGEIPSADMGGGMQDSTDHSKEYASRFTAFNMMVQMLEEKYDCTIIDSYTHELDQVGRSKCHLIDSGAKRTIRCVVVERNGHVNYLLEIDVTGLSKWISTKCVRKIDTHNWKEQFSRIKKGVVTKSLGWPTQEMDAMFGFKKHIGISHPKSVEGHSTGIPTESILDWAGRIAEKL
ncbi:Tn7-like element transposition protein TnsE [Vibrio cholerae]|uniref:Tn7-like element transposition protein TnsE n=1 Tax=Vibrio cholerae TaxID=666 RepID=UPI00301E587C